MRLQRDAAKRRAPEACRSKYKSMTRHAKKYGRPYTPKELRNAGIVLFLMGILVTFMGYAYYRTGIHAQVVNTKWGSQLIGPVESNNHFFLFISCVGALLALSGMIPFFRGLKGMKELIK